tara:strand:+ start:401 stop:1234 length:834 start_codon:yes stop_codon:yes gene_type:complete
MAVWNKLINSGSNAHVESLEISSPPTLTPALEVDGEVIFHNLEVDSPTIPEGRLIKSVFSGNNTGTSRYVQIKQDFEVEVVDYLIPWNNALLDFNGDGIIGSSDLLEFLILFGIEVPQNSGFDANQDGQIGSADLLTFLIAFGEFTDDLGDTRPEIIWENYGTQGAEEDINIFGYNVNWTEEINGSTRVTADSVQNYYDNIGSDAFWEEFGVNYTNPNSPPSGYAQGHPTVLEYIEDSNPPSSIELIDIFKYIYFTQTTGGIYGGSNFYTAPLGYGI